MEESERDREKKWYAEREIRSKRRKGRESYTVGEEKRERYAVRGEKRERHTNLEKNHYLMVNQQKNIFNNFSAVIMCACYCTKTVLKSLISYCKYNKKLNNLLS